MQSTMPAEVVGLERQDPLPVVDAEGAGRVRQDVGELAADLAVLAQQAARSSRGSRYHSGVRTNGYTHR